MLINLRTLGQAPAAFFQRRAMRHSPLGQRQGLRFVRPAIAQQSHKYRIAFMPQGSLGQRCETRQRCLSFKRSSPGSMPQGEPPWPLWQLTFHPGELLQVKKATRAVPIAGHVHVSDFLYLLRGRRNSEAYKTDHLSCESKFWLRGSEFSWLEERKYFSCNGISSLASSSTGFSKCWISYSKMSKYY